MMSVLYYSVEVKFLSMQLNECFLVIFLTEPLRACKTASTFSLSEKDFASEVAPKKEDDADIPAENKKEMKLLDLYCGCGAMSTGLCLGANLAGINLVTV